MRRFRFFPQKFRSVLGAAAWAFVLSVDASADAHGRFPASNGLVFDPTNADHLIVRTTFGLYDNETASAGPKEGWRYVCAVAAGFNSDKEDPALTFAGGRLVLGTFGGLVVGSEDRCDYEPVALVAERYVVGFAALPRPDAPAKGSPVLALSSNGTGVDAFSVKLFETTDGAASWEEFGSPFSVEFLALSIAASPKEGEPNAWGTLYVSGRDGNELSGYQAVVLRSDDRGVSWQRNVVPGLDGVETLPYLQAVSPTAPLTVYAAGVLDAPPLRRQTNLVSRDGGVTWSSYFEAEEILPGFALSPDGMTVAFGGEKTGLRVVAANALAEAKTAAQTNKTRVGCLSWNAGGLYACGNAFVDGFSVGKSQDGGATFSPVTSLTSACGPLECEPSTDVGMACSEVWATEAKELIAPTSCTPAPATAPDDPGACQCTTAPSRGSAGLGVAAAGLLAFFLRRAR